MSTTNIKRALEYMRGMALTGDQSKARVAALAEVNDIERALAAAREEGRREGLKEAEDAVHARAGMYRTDTAVYPALKSLADVIRAMRDGAVVGRIWQGGGMSKAQQHKWSHGEKVQVCTRPGCTWRRYPRGVGADQRIRYAEMKDARPILKPHPCKGTP